MVQPLELRSSDSVLVFAPHPDDETLGSGGLLQRARAVGARVRVVFVTDGENNPWPQRVLERRWRLGDADRARWGKRRREEARRAFERLGIGEDAAVFLSLPDQGLTRLALTNREPLLAAIRREIVTHEPSLVVGPSPRDHHPDHSALGVSLQLARTAASEPSQAGGVDPARSRPGLITFFVHGRRAAAPEGEPLVLRLSAEEQRRKRQAVLAHASQLVFRGRFYLSFVGETEAFAVAGVPSSTDPWHPIREAVVDGEGYRLRIRSRSRLRWAQPCRLLLLACGCPSASTGLAIDLDARGGELEARSAVTGAVVGRVGFRGNRSRGEISLPRSLFDGATSLFVKMDHPWSFFDEDGWREIPAPGAARAAAALEVDSAVRGVA